MDREKAIVLSSGGLNSAVTASIAAAEHAVHLLHVRFGSRAARREEDMFNSLADRLDAPGRTVLDLPHVAALGISARTNRRQPLQDALALGDGPANCYVPGLVGSLLSAAYACAADKGATRVYIGVSENLGPPAPRTDTIYPDYSREFIHLYGHLFAVESGQRGITIEAPMIDLDRTAIIQLGRRLNTPFDLTWSCIAGDSTPCGRCVGCVTRTHGFLKAGLPDPLMSPELTAKSRDETSPECAATA